MIKISGLCKEFVGAGRSVAALTDLNLDLPPRSIYGVVGLSGAGKSTLVRCLAMLERPTRGHILLAGQDITRLQGKELRRMRQQLGMVFQHFNLLSSRTAAGNIALPLELRGTPHARIEQRVAELLNLVGLADKADAYPAALSGGQKQRVGIARAIAAYPSVLLCDEATSALDPETTQTVLQLLRSIQQQTGITIVMVTHEIQVVRDICTHVAVMDAGKVVESGPVERVLLSPSTTATKRLLGEFWAQGLPAYLGDYLAEHNRSSLFKLSFSGRTTLEPVISLLTKQFGTVVNILSGGISQVGGQPFGQLLVHLDVGEIERHRAISFLIAQGVRVEEVSIDAWTRSNPATGCSGTN